MQTNLESTLTENPYMLAKAINQLFNTNDNKERENIQACLDNIRKY